MNQRLAFIYNVMIVWNFGALLFLVSVMVDASYRICDSGTARAFLNHVSVLPPPLFSTAGLALGGYLLLAVVSYAKRLSSSPPRLSNLRLFVGMAEVALAVYVVLKLNVGYSGVLLLVIVDLVTEVEEHSKRLALLAVSLTFFLLADYNLVSLLVPMVPFQQYLTCYSAAQQNLFLGIRSVLSSVNLIIFLVYMLILLRSQQKEALRIEALNAQVNQANAELKQINTRLIDYAEKTEKLTEIRERNRVAREIHDTVGHALTGISVGIDACITMIDFSPEATKKQLQVISEVARQGIRDIRRSVSKLRPDALENAPLENALQDMIREMGAAAQISISLDNRAGPLHFNKDEEDVIYRVAQEGITNAIRHGKAMRIRITIERCGSRVLLTVRDDGVGCKEIHKGFGLQHMQERVAQLGGMLEYDGSDGFTVKAAIPIRWGEES